MTEHSSIMFAQEGSNVKMMHVVARPALEKVPPSVYGIDGKDSEITFKFQKLKFTLPKKVYGSHDFYHDIITKDYGAGSESVGVLLSGHKGCGKTLLAEMLGNWALKRGLPVFHIHTNSVEVMSIYNTVKNVGPCCVIIDEFEKLYSDDSDVPNTQLHFLTMLSDASLKGVLWVFTANDKDDIADALLDRPGRLKYYIESPTLPVAVINGYLADRPDINPVIKRCILTSFKALSGGQIYIFDHLRAICAIAPGYTDPELFYKHADMLNIPGLFKLQRIGIVNEDLEVEVKAVYQDGILEVTANGAIIFSDDIIEYTIAKGSRIPGLNGTISLSRDSNYVSDSEIYALVKNFTAEEKEVKEARIAALRKSNRVVWHGNMGADVDSDNVEEPETVTSIGAVVKSFNPMHISYQGFNHNQEE